MGRKFKITKSVWRTSLSIMWVSILLHATNSFLLINVFDQLLQDKTDSHIIHEVEHLRASLKYSEGKLVIDDYHELEETDLKSITETPYFLQVYDPLGNIQYQSSNIKKFGEIPIQTVLPPGMYEFSDLNIYDSKLRSCYTKIWDQITGEYLIMQLTSTYNVFSQIIKSVILFNLIGFPFVVLVIFVISVFLARKFYSPLTNIINVANRISADNISERLTFNPDQYDEIEGLKKTLNNLFTRLEDQIGQISNFTDNASHQLMTPLTAIQAELDFIGKKERSIPEYIEAITSLKVQTHKMINIIKTMLILAREEDLPNEYSKIFDITSVVKNDIISLYKYHNNISFNVPDSEIFMRGNSEYMTIVLINLLDNSIKYSPDDTQISLNISEQNNKLIISVEDFGIGITDDEKVKIFDRFYRGSKTEIYGIKGYGLGLSLVKTIVSSIKGEIEIDNNRKEGVEFKLIFDKINLT